MNKISISKYLEKTIHIIFCIVFFICAFFSLFHFPQYSLLFRHSAVKTILFAVLATLIMMIWEYIFKGKTDPKWNRIRILIFAILVSVQVFIFLKTITPIGWDVLEVVNSAEYGMYNGDYFAKHTNNLFMQIFLSAYLKLTSFIPNLSTLRKLELLNLFFVDSAILMGILVTKKILGTVAADRVFILSFLLIGFHPTLSVVYSDTLAMPFPIAIFLCFVYGMSMQKTSQRAMLFAIGAALGVIGYCIKPTVIIVEIAICILCILYKKRGFFKSDIWLSLLAAVLLSFLTCGVIYEIEKPVKQELQTQYPDIKPRGMLHYMALGLCEPDDTTQGYGCYNETEVMWMQQHINDDNYIQEAIEHIKSKIVQFGPIGYLRHLLNKLIWTGSDGTFFYGGEGGFHLENQSSTDTLRGRLQNAFYIETNFYQNWFSNWMQGVWLLVCIKCVMCYLKKDYNIYTSVAKLSILGLFLFLLLFENRSRYLFLYLPLLLVCSESRTGRFKKLNDAREGVCEQAKENGTI